MPIPSKCLPLYELLWSWFLHTAIDKAGGSKETSEIITLSLSTRRHYGKSGLLCHDKLLEDFHIIKTYKYKTFLIHYHWKGGKTGNSTIGED